MASIRTITEGITDFVVLEYIIPGILNDYDVEINSLQPIIDEYDVDLAITDGNWDRVFKYCSSEDFRNAFKAISDLVVVIQLDADVFRSEEVSQKYRFSFVNEDGSRLTTIEIADTIISLVIKEIGEEFYASVEHKIVFAIAVDSTECWMLPAYYQDARSNKTANCLGTLNQELQKKYSFRIDKKKPGFYRKALKPYVKHRNVQKALPRNESLKKFADELLSRYKSDD